MLVKTILFLLLVYLAVGFFRHFFEIKNKPITSPKIKKTKTKNLSNFFVAEEVPFEEIENTSNDK
jgi:hypothetical protein